MIETHKESLTNFLAFPQTQQKLSFISKFLEVFGMNLEEQVRLRQNIRELEDNINSVDDDIEELEEQLESHSHTQETLEELETELITLQKQKNEYFQLKDELDRTLKVKTYFLIRCL